MRVYSETQRFNQIWLWVILLFCDGMVLYKLYPVLVVDGAFNTNLPTAELLSVVVAPIFLLLLNVFIISIRLDTHYNKEGISYKFWPIMWSFKTIKPQDIVAYEVKDINPLFSFGGWGYRRRIGKLLLNTRGKYGIEIKRKQGIMIALGTQQPEAVKEVMQYIMAESSNN